MRERNLEKTKQKDIKNERKCRRKCLDEYDERKKGEKKKFKRTCKKKESFEKLWRKTEPCGIKIKKEFLKNVMKEQTAKRSFQWTGKRKKRKKKEREYP